MLAARLITNVGISDGSGGDVENTQLTVAQPGYDGLNSNSQIDIAVVLFGIQYQITKVFEEFLC